jgi:hypothetical protein
LPRFEVKNQTRLDFKTLHSSDIFLAESAEVDYKAFAYLVYSDPVKFNVIPDPSLPANMIFHVSTVPPLESVLVLAKVANWLDSVAGQEREIFYGP